MSERWIRLAKIFALVVGAYLVVVVLEVLVGDQRQEIPVQLGYDSYRIEDRSSYSIADTTVDVVRLTEDSAEPVLIATTEAIGYQSRMRVYAVFPPGADAGRVAVSGAAESVGVDRALPREPEDSQRVLDALTGATTTHRALDEALRASRLAVERFREDAR
jgi:hypothetical protein